MVKEYVITYFMCKIYANGKNKSPDNHLIP